MGPLLTCDQIKKKYKSFLSIPHAVIAFLEQNWNSLMSNICTLYVIIGSGPDPGNSLESPDSVRNPDFEKTWSKFHHYFKAVNPSIEIRFLGAQEKQRL